MKKVFFIVIISLIVISCSNPEEEYKQLKEKLESVINTEKYTDLSQVQKMADLDKMIIDSKNFIDKNKELKLADSIKILNDKVIQVYSGFEVYKLLKSKIKEISNNPPQNLKDVCNIKNDNSLNNIRSQKLKYLDKYENNIDDKWDKIVTKNIKTMMKEELTPLVEIVNNIEKEIINENINKYEIEGRKYCQQYMKNKNITGSYNFKFIKFYFDEDNTADFTSNKVHFIYDIIVSKDKSLLGKLFSSENKTKKNYQMDVAFKTDLNCRSNSLKLKLDKVKHIN